MDDIFTLCVLSLRQLHALAQLPRPKALTPAMLACLSQPPDPRPLPSYTARSVLVELRLGEGGLPKAVQEVVELGSRTMGDALQPLSNNHLLWGLFCPLMANG